MNLQFYLEKLHASENFKNFIKENPDAYLCSGFFVIDKEGKDNKQHFDFWVPSLSNPPNSVIEKSSLISKNSRCPIASPTPKNSSDDNSNDNTSKASAIKASDSERYGKIFSFQLEEGCRKVDIENLSSEVPEKISVNFDISFEEIEELINKKMEEEKMKSKIQKILLSLQKLEERDVLVGTVFISGLGMLKVNIDIAEKKITDFEKKSFFDMLKVTKGKGKEE
ncbi:unnamed protein product [marine sediment metagenome]|uniref:Uncharacterized protein n=1 Tax=marine sediment metagenome TaxID=412755 RepID=X0SSR4_9ZZZZ